MVEPGGDALARTSGTVAGRARALAGAAAVAIAYGVAAACALKLAALAGGAASVSPAAGIALAACVHQGMIALPGIAAATWAAYALAGHGPELATAATFGYALAMLCARMLLARNGAGGLGGRGPSAVALCAAAAPGAAISAAIGAGAVTLAGAAPVELAPYAFAWWLGDLAGMLVVAPFVLAWQRPAARVEPEGSDRVAIAAFWAALAAAFALIAAAAETEPAAARAGVFVSVGFAAWAARRHGSRTATAAALAMTIALAWLLLRTPLALGLASPGEGWLLLHAWTAAIALVVFAVRPPLRTARRGEADLHAGVRPSGASSPPSAAAAVTTTAEPAWTDERASDSTALASGDADRRFRLLVEGVGEYAIFMVDPHARVATWNSGAERIMGYTAAEIVGQHASRLYTADDRASGKPESLLARAVEHGAVEDEGWRVRKDGVRFWANAVICALYADDGALRGFAEVTRDTTLRKQVAALEEVGRQTRRFLSILGHELRNPLAPIRNAVGLLRLREAADPQLKYCNDLIERQVQHLARLVDDLLDASRVTSAMVGLEQERLELARVASGAIDATRPLIAQLGHTLTADFGTEALAVAGDPARLQRAIQNLLDNAARFTPPGGKIGVRVYRQGESGAIEVSDDGAGIPADMLPRIFEPFAQGDSRLARAEGGLGVGLSLARRIVELHGGSVEAASAGVGRGATFTVRLPLLIEPAAAAQAAAVNDAPAPAARRIMLVEDNRDAADSLAALLGMRGHEVLVAYDGPSALALAAESRPEMVLLDIGLPGMDGYEVCKRLRAASDLRTCRIVALSGYAEPRDAERAAGARFDAHLVKPVDADKLYRVIENGDSALV